MNRLSIILMASLSWVGSQVLGSMHGEGRIAFIDSYHEGYHWSDGTVEGFENALKAHKVDYKIFRMDTKRQKSKEHGMKIASEIAKQIKEYKPSVIVASDDNAQKYLITKYFIDGKTPIVFCGVNWTTESYGYKDSKNVVGMIEVALIPQIMKLAGQLSPTKKSVFLAANVLSMQKEIVNYRNSFNLDIEEKFVDTVDEWKAAFRKAQKDNDFILLGNHAGLAGWDEKEMIEFVEKEAKVASATIHENMAPFAHFALAKIPQEHGEWAAKAALSLIKGQNIKNMVTVKNRKGKLYYNKKITEKTGKKLPETALTRAIMIPAH